MASAIFPRDQASQELVGPFLIGIIANYFFWGIQVTQSYYYYKSFRATDRTWLKFAVAALFAADAAQSICVSEGVWRFMVDGWGVPNPVLQRVSVGFNIITIFDALTASIVHALYAQRIWTLLNAPYNTICACMVLFLSTFQLAGGIGCTALAISINITLATFFHIKTWACIWLITSAVTDILITGIMTWKLSRSRTGFKRTDDIITKLIRVTVETGLAPAIAQILDLVVFLVWPAKSYHVTLTLLNPKVYSNSMMALLNSRQQRNKGEVEVWSSSHESRHDKPIENIQIHTSQSVHMAADDYELRVPRSGNTSARLRRDDESPTDLKGDVLPYSHPYSHKADL